jgi:phage gp29-like protein
MATSSLIVDPLGVPVEIPTPPPRPPIDDPIPGAESSWIDRYRSYPSRDLTGPKITQILQEADAGLPRRWVELCEEMVEKDPKIANLLATRKGAVLGLRRRCTPPPLEDGSADLAKAEEIAKFCQVALDAANTEDMLRNQLGAIGFPFAIDWIVWDPVQGVPLRFLRVPPRHVLWDIETDAIKLYDIANVHQLGSLVMGEFIPPHATVRSIASARADHPTRCGLLRTLIYPYFFKITAVKNWVSFAERYGMPLRALFLPVDQINDPAIVSKMQYYLHTLGTDASGIFSAGSELKLIEHARIGRQSMYIELVDWVNKEMAGLVLGHELSSQSAPGPGQLGITAATQVKQDILEDDCEYLAEVVRRDVLIPMTAWNFGWENTRLAPFLDFDYDPPSDLASEVNVLSTFAKTFPDFEFSESQLRDKFGYDAPAEDDPEDAISAGMPEEPGDDPDNPDPTDPNPGVPVPSPFNAAHVRPRPSRKSVERLAQRGRNRADKSLGQWRDVIRAEVLAAAEAEEPPTHLVHRLAHLYPKIDARKLERAVYETTLLARLYGRASRRK